MSDITLTTGIRQNLLSLQQTSNDLTTTQEALATGKKVNSAADNPSSYFTSQNLNQTAHSLASLLDQIGQGSQTINAATDGLTGLTSLLQQALSTAQQAQSSNWTVAATTTAATSVASLGTAGTLVIDVGTSTYSVSLATGTLAQVEAQINNTTGLGSNGIVSATDDGSGHLILTSNEPPIGFTVSANATSAALGITTSSTSNNIAIGSSSTRSTLQTNFNNLLTQINQLAADSGYNGINLLAGDSLTIDFNPTGTSTLNITGVTFNAAGLGLGAVSGTAASSFQSDNQLATTVAQINAALATVQTQTETFGTNASTITTRQTFETALINTLQTGATNLVVADQNEESANLLTEQTQQQLEISALSIANQANQSVLKLFG
jgi:flagellin-like hook-associated protein FlgL